MNIKKNFVIIIFISSLLIINVNSQSRNLKILTNTLPLTGSQIENQAALRDLNDIVIATFISTGYRGPGSAGVDEYDKAEIQISSVLAGKLTGRLQASYSVDTSHGKHQEQPPIIGRQYIIFIDQFGPNYNNIEKILPATDKNIIEVKKLLPNTSASASVK